MNEPRARCAFLKSTAFAAAVAVLSLAPAASASPSRSSWALAEITRVTSVGVLGDSAAEFRPQAPLTERALAAAIAATDKLLEPPAPAPAAPAAAPVATPAPAPVQVLSSIADGATVSGTADWEVEVPGQDIQQVAFALDGTQLGVARQPPFALPGGLATGALADGSHQLAVAATRSDGGTYVAVWSVTTANAAGAVPSAPAASLVPVPVTKSPPAQVAASVPSPVPAAPPTSTPPPKLYQARAPSRFVTIEELDAALVGYLGLDSAAREFQQKLGAAGLDPRPGTGSEIVARLLDLRLDHPAGQDNLELLPFQSATRAEAAYSFAQVLSLDTTSAQQSVESLADTMTLPSFTPWQLRILRTAVSYVGYPYVWGGTSPTTETEFGSTAPGGFDCSGFVWRVYKLTPYPNEGDLADVLRGRTTYVMSGEVPRSERISASNLEPGDTLFFGVGPRSKPSQVDHMGIYVGGSWMIDSSGEGVTLVPFDGWYLKSFAWARRPLQEAGLT